MRNTFTKGGYSIYVQVFVWFHSTCFQFYNIQSRYISQRHLGQFFSSLPTPLSIIMLLICSTWVICQQCLYSILWFPLFHILVGLFFWGTSEEYVNYYYSSKSQSCMRRNYCCSKPSFEMVCLLWQFILMVLKEGSQKYPTLKSSFF